MEEIEHGESAVWSSNKAEKSKRDGKDRPLGSASRRRKPAAR